MSLRTSLLVDSSYLLFNWFAIVHKHAYILFGRHPTSACSNSIGPNSSAGKRLELSSKELKRGGIVR